MKKVLITGAAGTVGYETLKSLLTEGKYDISAVDLNNLKSKTLFKTYKSRVNVITGDLTDQILVEELVKNHDIIIHLASVTSSITSISDEIAKITEYSVVENFVRAINYYNPDCHLIYASSTGVYGNNLDNYSVKSKPKQNHENSFLKYKLKSETRINSKLNNFTIVRIPLVLTKLKKEDMFYNIKLNSMISTISKEDVAYMFSTVCENKDKYNKQIINVSGNETFNMVYKDLIKDLIRNDALNIKMVLSLLFLDKNYYSPVVEDTIVFNKKLDYQNDQYNNYLKRIKYNNKNKYISRFMGRVILKVWERKK